MSVYLTAISYILLLFGYCGHFSIFLRFGMLYQEKSGNPGQQTAPPESGSIGWIPQGH
jgi:hypothetical protein